MIQLLTLYQPLLHGAVQRVWSLWFHNGLTCLVCPPSDYSVTVFLFHLIVVFSSASLHILIFVIKQCNIYMMFNNLFIYFFCSYIYGLVYFSYRTYYKV